MEKQSLELLLAQGESIERIAKRFGKHPSTVSYWMEKYGLTSPYTERHAAKGGIDREQLEALVEAGLSIAEIAAAVGRSKATVRHWLPKHGLQTKRSAGRRADPAARSGKQSGLLTVTMHCRHHGETEFIIEGRGYYRCKRCRVERVSRRRRKVKSLLVAEAGGRCAICGYDRYLGALEFHHLDPAEKRLALSYNAALAIETLRSEAAKCVLLCSNCHAEVEAGVSMLALE
jgi:transposase